MNSPKHYSFLKRIRLPLLTGVFVILCILSLKAQERPPRPITVKVSTLQFLQFGSFIQAGNYGTVTVDYNGIRSATGSVILPSISSSASPTPALFLVDAEPGTLITIVNDNPAFLSNGGYQLTLTIGESSTNSPFVTQSQETRVYIGGTLEVGPLTSNPAGSYNGTFHVTFIQE